MHAVSTNQIADILHYNGNVDYDDLDNYDYNYDDSE